MCDDIVTVDWNKPLVEKQMQPNKSSNVIVDTLFDAFGKANKNKTGEKQYRMPELKEAKEVKTSESEEAIHIDGASHELFDRTCEGEEKQVFAYKTGISFHVGKYMHTSSHSAGVNQPSYASGVSPGANCFRTSQNRLRLYTDVSGGIEFPKIKMVPVDSFRFKQRERRWSFLNKEEMEAAEALADFAYRVRHGECN